MRSIGWLLGVATMCVAAGCTDNKQDTPPPGPPPPKVGSAPPATSAGAAAAHVCASGGGQDPDAESAAYLPRKVDAENGAYCLKPDGEVLTYGEKGKLTMDEVCTTAFDGECEVYKRFGLKRVVTLSYVDDAGKGANVEIVLSRFASPDGAYGMFTKRVVADGDPKGEGVPKPLAAGAAGAIGTGRAYVVKGAYLVELQYNSDTESPAQVAISSGKALPVLAKQIGDKLPGDGTLPPAVKALPQANLVANGVAFFPGEVPGFGNVGPAAFGFYDEGGVRTRVLSIVRPNEAEAKTAFGTIKSKGKPVAGVGDEAVALTVGADKTPFVVARKGARIVGAGDEEFAIKAGGKSVTADGLTEITKKLVAAP